MTLNADSMTDTLLRRRELSIPVPLPVTSSGVLPETTAVIALAAVVLPIPMSPMANAFAPPSIALTASSAPTSRDVLAWDTVIAGPLVMFIVPMPTLRSMTPDGHFSLVATPMSTTSTLAPT